MTKVNLMQLVGRNFPLHLYCCSYRQNGNVIPCLHSPTKGYYMQRNGQSDQRLEKSGESWEFELFSSTIQITWGIKMAKIISAFEKNGQRKMRFRKPQRNCIAELPLRCLKDDTSDCVPISGLLPRVNLFLIIFKLV